MAIFRVCASSERKLIHHPSSSLQYPHSLRCNDAVNPKQFTINSLSANDRTQAGAVKTAAICCRA
jgi:hypothetical protein